MRYETVMRPTVIVVGGDENALSVARSLAPAGIRVHLLNRRHRPAGYSRQARSIALDGDASGPADWARFLTSSASDWLAGAVLLTCSDEAIELVLDNWQALAAKFRLEICPPAVRRALLDKLDTYRIAAGAGVPVPGFWIAEDAADLERITGEARFPLLVKPRLSHHSLKIGRKHIRADTPSELAAAFVRVAALGIPAVVMEFIPGGDDRLCSYYTYIDADGRPLLHFTKRHPRRYPMNLGRATFHETTWNPEAAELGERFFRHAGLRGLGNIEFKRDDRDGRLKIIEANARFTASNALAERCGLNLALIVHAGLTGTPPPVPLDYPKGMTMWFPLEDVLAFLQLRREGQMTWTAWLRSVCRASVLPYFRADDPLPSVVNFMQRVQALAGHWRKRGKTPGTRVQKPYGSRHPDRSEAESRDPESGGNPGFPLARERR